MPSLFRQTSIAANFRNDNVVSGSAFEIARVRQVVSIGVTGAATGLVMSITSGADLILEESPLQVKTTYAVIPDEFYFNDIMEPGDRLVIAVRNTTAGAIVANIAVLIGA